MQDRDTLDDIDDSVAAITDATIEARLRATLSQAAVPFRMSFGFRFANEPHPVFPQAHPHGWLTIWASDYEQARSAAWHLFQGAWCDLYSPETWDEMAADIGWNWPFGQLGELQVVPGWQP